MSTIFVAQSGTSITTRSWDAAGQAIVPDGNRLNCVAGVSQVAANPTPDRYFDPAAFTNATAGTFGNCGRNNLIAPSTWNVDLSVLKDFQFSEKHRLQFRTEMFNAPNHPAWGRPSASWGSSNLSRNVGFGRHSFYQPVTADSIRSEILFLGVTKTSRDIPRARGAFTRRCYLYTRGALIACKRLAPQRTRAGEVHSELWLNESVWPVGAANACPEDVHVMPNQRPIVRATIRSIFIILAMLTSDLIQHTSTDLR